MPDAIRFIVLADPISKGRPRFGKGGRTFTPPRTREAEEVIALHARAAAGEAFAVPVEVVVQFHCATRRRVDLDNLLKLVLDGMNGIAYADDVLVERISAGLTRKAEGETPRTEVCVRPLGVSACTDPHQ